ncbi:preprotein translocase subunit SecY [Buchnera aphidicola]|uniref:Protein translocase subunit SecY n=1 Tax=Buchnera aphidicola (Therioaphis trifolii) TaxID=1241884 RepID=A0A4D6YBN3_9GAMM|nr:preprotein translocase subunit SecY [Buchnera aphidicola]QCI27316.1 preprotein translocase subunit SecY [Buchnera aphidicola (Therioaphis trifolii)]
MINIMQYKLKNFSKTLLELKQRIVFVIFAIIIFRIGFFIPIPSINISMLSNFLKLQKNTIIDLFNMFSGGALSHASIFSLGIMPYISASIIMQLLSLSIKRLSDIKKEGEIGKKKIYQYTRFITLILSIIQSTIISFSLPKILSIQILIPNPNFYFYFSTILSLSTGTMLLMWLGELITECGIGNGISIIMFIGIISKIPLNIINIFHQMYYGNISILFLFFIFILIFLIVFFIVFIEQSYRKIILYHSKQRNLHKMYIMQHTHLPLKINMSGILPVIFSSSIIILLSTICSWLEMNFHFTILSIIKNYIQPGKICYIIIYSILITIFCFFYSNLICNAVDISKNLKKSGVFIPGIRPGIKTAKYINDIINKLIFINSLYIIFIFLISEFFRIIIYVPFYIGGTSLLIIVVVIIDFISQFQTLMISNKYNSILKKSNLGINNFFI